MDQPYLDHMLKLRSSCWNGTADQTTLEEYIKYIKHMPDSLLELQYQLFVDLAFLEIYFPRYVYPAYYCERRELLDCIVGKLNISMEEKKNAQNAEKRKIALCLYTLRDQVYSIGYAAISLANAFSDMGYQTALFIENQYVNSNPYGISFPTYMCEDAHDFCENHLPLLRNNVRVVYNDGQSLRERTMNFLHSIAEFEPDNIMDVQDECSFCSKILSKQYEMIYIPMRSGIGSSMYFHKYLCADYERMMSVEERFHCIGKEKMIPFHAAFIEYPKAKLVYDKAAKIGSEQIFVLVTVGVRLIYEMEALFMESVCRLLEKRNMTWLIVGSELPQFLKEKYQELIHQKKIIAYGMENDLPALYNICDVYLQPNRIGGGISVTWAMRQGLPVAMLRFPSDGLEWLGKENAVEGSYVELIKYIDKLYSDRSFYNQMSTRVREKSYKNTVANCTESMIRILNWK